MKFVSMIKVVFLGVAILFSGAAVATAVEIEIIKDVQFYEASGIPLKADVFVREGEGPFPIVVAVHGGGFVRGDKEDIARQCRTIAEAGYVVFDANYRTLSMGVFFPAFIKDVHTAAKWIKKHAGEYRGDPERLALMGFSAGAYISSLVAVTTHVKKLQHEKDGLADVSSEVQAVIPFYGHHDLAILDEVQQQTARLIWGRKVDEKIARLASPASYMEHAVPTLLFHNEIDPLVPVEQSRSMYRHLKEAGVPVYYYEFPEKAHDLLPDDEKWALGVAAKFLDVYLKGKKDTEMPGAIPEREKLRDN
ncbi:MAG: alpha/beta hydrolase [bacterium]